MLINDIGVSDKEGLCLVRQRLADARAELSSAEAALHRHEEETRNGSRRVRRLLMQRKTNKLRKSIAGLKAAIRLGEKAECELLARIKTNTDATSQESLQ